MTNSEKKLETLREQVVIEIVSCSRIVPMAL